MSTYTIEAAFAGGLPANGTLEITEGTMTGINFIVPDLAPFTDLTLADGSAPPGAFIQAATNPDNFLLTFIFLPNTYGTLYEMQSATILTAGIIKPDGFFYTTNNLTGTITCADLGPCQFHPSVPAPEVGTGPGAILALILLGAALWRRATV